MDRKLLSTDRPVAVFYAFPSEVETITPTGVSTRNVVFKDQNDWKAINTTIGTIDLQETPGSDGSGSIHNNTLAATCPGHDQDTPDEIATITGRKVLLRIDYKSGLKKLIGNLESAPKLFIKTASNTSTSRKIQADWKSSKPNYFLT